MMDRYLVTFFTVTKLPRILTRVAPFILAIRCSQLLLRVFLNFFLWTNLSNRFSQQFPEYPARVDKGKGLLLVTPQGAFQN